MNPQEEKCRDIAATFLGILHTASPLFVLDQATTLRVVELVVDQADERTLQGARSLGVLLTETLHLMFAQVDGPPYAPAEDPDDTAVVPHDETMSQFQRDYAASIGYGSVKGDVAVDLTAVTVTEGDVVGVFDSSGNFLCAQAPHSTRHPRDQEEGI